MSENMDSHSNNLCIPEDAFDQFQAVSMYQEEKYITLTEIATAKPKEPDPGELIHLSYDNEVVVTTENEVNSTVDDNTEEMESIEQQSLDNSVIDDGLNVIDQNCEPQKVSKRGRKKKHVFEDDTNIVSNCDTLLDSQRNSTDIQVNTEKESPLITSTVGPRKRGRKPKPKLPFPIEPVTPSGINQEISNTSMTSFSSDPENTDSITNVVKRKRGRPRKVSLPSDQINSRDLSSELSGSDNNRIDDLLSPSKLKSPSKGRRGRPRKVSLETNIDSQIKYPVENPSNDLISIEDLNETQPTTRIRRKESLELDLTNIEQMDVDNKLKLNSDTKLKNDSNTKIQSEHSGSENDDLDDISLSKLKELPETIKSTEENVDSENNKDHNSTNNNNFNQPTTPGKRGKGRPKKLKTGIPNKVPADTLDQSDPIVDSSTSTNNTQLEDTEIEADETDNLSLSQLKKIKTETLNIENNNTAEDQNILDVAVENSAKEVNGTPSKRNSKMPVMSDFEYNLDSVVEKETGMNEDIDDNNLLVEDTSKRPIRRKVPKLRYDEESDEDPFANVELSDDDDEPRRRKGNRYYSDDEYIPGRRGNKDIDSTDSEANELLGETKKQKKKKLHKKSDSQSPRKRGKSNEQSRDVESDDIEICLEPSVIKASEDSQSQPSRAWGTSNEFENFLAKKIQGTNLKIKKLSATASTESKGLEIPVLDPEAKKTIEMCSQTNIISTVSASVQTSTLYDIPMKETIALTAEQSEKACYFLNSIVKTTSELGTLMTQKSEDFIKKKINTTHVTDTMKMDYCVKKSFLLFKLAKHNLMQMEEDLAKQYEEFLKSNNLAACREVQKEVVPSAKPASSDSDCEIVEEPVKVTPGKKSQDKPKFNPKTVFLNKELSIKIAKKPTENKKLDIKGRHTVWINDTVMVKKVKPTQSFLAQDSRNKKPPDNSITTKMVSDFFKNYYRQKAISVCAPYITTDWLNVSRECVCNYFVVKPVQFNNDVNYSESGGISTSSSASASETNHAIKHIANKTIVTCPETLLKLCFRIVKNQMHDTNHVKEVSQHKQNEITDAKDEPVTLFRLCLRAMTGRAVYIMERSPTPSQNVPSVAVSQTALPLKVLCHRRMVDILSNSTQKDSMEEQESVAETRCSTEESNAFFPIYSSKFVSSSRQIRKEIKSLLSLCVEFIQQEQILETSNISILIPKSLKFIAFECVKQLLYEDLNVSLFETSQLNLNQHNDETMIEGLTINSVNTLSEEAFLNLEQSHADVPDSPEYSDDFDNEDHCEPDFNETEEDNQTETSWVSQVQMQELRSCFSTTNSDVNQGENLSIVTQIKLEPLDDIPENISSPAHVKIEPLPVLDEMTTIPGIKPEVDEHSGPVTLQRQNSSSYDVDAFEQFASSSKIMHEINGEDIFSQSVHRVRRQHEPDYDDDDTSMSLLVPHMFVHAPLSIETAKGSLMESSSDEDSSKTKKLTGKKKPDKRNKGKQKKPDPKTSNKEIPTLTKEKAPNIEVANLTKRMRDKIRQEEKKDDSTDSESENIPLRLRRRKEQDKSKPSQTSKAKDSEIQCNNVDSTDQVDDDVVDFTGFTAIDQNEISTYQKYMKYVYDKIIPEKEEEISKINNTAVKEKEGGKESLEVPLISNEPVELLECEPTMPIFDEPVNERRSSRKYKGKVELLKKEELPKKVEISKKEELPKKVEISKKEVVSKQELLKNEEILKKEATPKKEETSKEEVLKEPAFIDRHGWQCYPLDTKDSKLYQNVCVALEKLPESFVQTYFEYQSIANKDDSDSEIDRLTNLNSLNRTVQLQNLSKTKMKPKRDDTGERISETGSRPESPTFSDHCDELEPSDDEGAKVEDEVAPPVALKHTENTLAKNLLMNDNDSDSDGPGVKVKQEPSDDTSDPKKSKPSSKHKKKEDVVVENSADLMLTADKMMNKELTLLHAPVVVTEDIKDTSSKGPVTRNKQKSASKNPSSSTKTKNEEDSSSEEEKQWVTTKEKLLKRLGKKEHASVDDAKRAKLVSEFIERRGDFPDSHMRNRCKPSRRFSKKFLERQKQLRVLSKELFGESSDSPMSKRSQKAQAASLLYKGRRNIRKVIDKKSLARSTVVANMEEFERKRRLNAKQTKLRELLGCEEGVNVLVINDEVCLEYDFEENRPVVTIHPFFTKVMKAHQYEGVKFMWDACFESLAEIASGHPGGGCILAHCMGLGKTLQVLALLHTVLTHPGVTMQRVLVCCPLSTVLNWVDEIHKWIGPVTNQIKVFELSKLKKTYERAYQLEDWYNGGGIFIIGYELFRSLSTLDPFLDDIRPTIINKIRTALLDPGPDIVVCDEGHLLKNDCSVLAVAMSRVVTKRRIILTGTPMQNNLREYYCMVNFVKPNLLGTYSEYSNRFENPIMNGQHRDSREEDIKLMKARTHILHKVLEGCLQRQEASVLYPYLPKKHEYTVFITLTPCQWDLYKHYLNTYGKTSKQSILKDFHILQKIWSHPQVLHNFQTKARDRDERNRIKMEKLEDDLATEDLEEIKPNAAEDLWWLEYLDGGNMLETLDSSNKFVVVFRILDECIALGDKVLIFSTSLFCLDALEYFLKKINKWSLGNEYYRLDGSVPAEVRQKWCREFNADNNYKTKLFLVSTRAGCLGLNMTAANRVIIMDTSWNPAHDIQSIFRVYRFGQKKDCYIYRLVAMGTMEQKIYERSVTKQAVACRVVDEQQIDRHYNMADLTELYKFDEGGSCVAGGVAVGVHDVALLRVARETALHAVHEHDSLLRGSSEQGLPEHERNAAWMQFQQEQAHKQMENKLILNIPTIPAAPLKRLHGHDYALSPKPQTEIKKEDTSDDFTPNEPKAKKGKRHVPNIIKCCIPIQDNEQPNNTQKINTNKGRPKKGTFAIKPGTSKEYNDTVPSTDSILPDTQNQEEIMVEKITDILLKYNFQSRKGNLEISNLVTKVRNMVKKGYVADEDLSDDLTASIAKVLLPKQVPLPKVTDIMCESINNSVTPNANRSDADPELITSDPTPRFTVFTHQNKPTTSEFRTKRKAAIAAEKSIDSLAHDVIINLDDDDWDSRDTDFVPGEQEGPQSVPQNKGKKKTKNLSPSKNYDSDESTLSAEPTPQKIDIDVDYNKTQTPSFSNKETKQTLNFSNKETKNTSTPKQPYGPKRLKDKITKMSNITEKNENQPNKTIDKEPTKIKAKDFSSSILLSDDDEPGLSLKSREKITEETSENPSEKPAEKTPEDNDVVSLPSSLLKNQNFINIVAHTYLAGNPMLDADAATLAAQYSTLKALKEAEQTGKDVCSGPIYDIAVQVIGKEALKKMHSVNPRAASSSADDAAASIQMKEKMIASEKTSKNAKSSKTSKLREDMIKEKLGMKNSPPDVHASIVVKPTASMTNKVVPVGLIKTSAGISANQSFGQPHLTPERSEPRVECILPDDDDIIISDVRANPAPPAPATPPAPPPTNTSKPVVLNPIMYKSKNIGYEAPSFRVTVGNASSASTSQTATPPKIILKPYMAAAELIPDMLAAAVKKPPVKVKAASGPSSVGVERILPNNDTICLDSDDEETITPNAQPSTSSAMTSAPTPVHLQQAPVPVSLTMAAAPGVKLPLPTVTNLAPANVTQPSQSQAQTLVLRQVVTAAGVQPKYVLIPSDKLPIPKLKPLTADKPMPLSAKAQNSSFHAAPGESILSAHKAELAQSINKASCKPGDILRISKTGVIEVINRNEMNAAATESNSVIVPHPNQAQKPVTSKSVDLTSVITEAGKPKPTALKPSISASFDLTHTSPDVAKAKTSTQINETNKNQKKVDNRRARQISSSSSSNSSRAGSPDNPLSILKDVVHIRAVDYPTTSAENTKNTKPDNSKSIVTRTEKNINANISVQHVVSADTKNTATSTPQSTASGVLKLTKIPKDKLPKFLDTAVEKQIQKDDLIKKITPLLSKNQSKPKVDPKSRGKNTITFDNLNSATTSKLLKGTTPAGKLTDKKGDSSKGSKGLQMDSKASSSKAPVTVDLTHIMTIGTTVSKSKGDVKKRLSSSVDSTTIKKKKTELMTLKDFNLDDMEDIIELE